MSSMSDAGQTGAKQGVAVHHGAHGMPVEVIGERAAVATGNPDAARAALRILSSGGSVVDAAIAASAVLTVTMPHATSIGGDAFVLTRDGATGAIHGLNASGTAPAAAMPEKFAGGMQQRGPCAAVVPGLVKAWEALHQRFGKVAWSALLTDAIALAQEGCVVSASLAQTIAGAEKVLGTDPGCAALFFQSGAMLTEGSQLRQPALAMTLDAISRHGATALFDGPVGQKLIDGIGAAGGLLNMADIQQFMTEWVDPVTANFGVHQISVMPPNSYGILMLLQLHALAGMPPEQLTNGAASRMVAQIRAMRASFDVALDSIGDPASMRHTTEHLLGSSTMAQVRARLAEQPVGTGPLPDGGTACVTVADIHGNAACIVQSIYNPFGSHFLDPTTGILLNNRMYGFDHQPGKVNSVGPGKRSGHTLNPVIVTRGGQLRWVYASPGGISQTVTGTQILVNLMLRGMSVAQAIHDSRWAVDRNRRILVEPALGQEVVDALTAAGFDPRREADGYSFGSATAIQYDGQVLRAAADRRRDASAMAF